MQLVKNGIHILKFSCKYLANFQRLKCIYWAGRCRHDSQKGINTFPCHTCFSSSIMAEICKTSHSTGLAINGKMRSGAFIRVFTYFAVDGLQHYNTEQWRSQNADTVTHIKGRLLYHAMTRYKYIPVQNGTFS